MRTDIFTRKHKSLRARLSEVGDAIGRADWTRDEEVKATLGLLQGLDDELLAHGKAEDDHFLPLLTNAPELFGRMEEAHEADLAHRARLMAAARAAADAPPAARADAGLDLYRAYYRYVAAYLQHLDEEETLVMPMLWASVPEEDLARALHRFIVEVASKQPASESAHMLAHVTPADRAELLRGLRARAPAAAFNAVRALLLPRLTEAERARLERDLAA